MSDEKHPMGLYMRLNSVQEFEDTNRLQESTDTPVFVFRQQKLQIQKVAVQDQDFIG